MNKKQLASLLLIFAILLTSVFSACSEKLENEPAQGTETSEIATSTATDVATSTDAAVATTAESSSETVADTSEETTAEVTNETTQEISSETSAETTAETSESTSEESSEETETTEIITDVAIGDTIEAEYAADFTVAKVFSNDMVVQRNEHIRVWGFAPESENGKKVSGEFKGMFAEALVENGEWCLTFGARLEADTEGAEMKIYTDEKEVVFSGVLVGDVYLILGQSNAAYTVNEHLQNANSATQGGGFAAINSNTIIRLNHLNGSGGTYAEKGTDYVYSDLQNTSYWKKTTQGNTMSFSALAYYFAKIITEKDPTVPVGLMEVAIGGAPIVSFLPNNLADEFGGDYKDNSTGIYYSDISTDHMGRYLYNCYLAPVSRYAIAGVLWYQGEGNHDFQNAVKYNDTFVALMTYMRSTHNLVNKDFPVFIVEFPSIYKKPAGYTDTWHYADLGIIRSYMGIIPTMLKNSYVSVSSDLWSNKEFYNNIHPYCKYEQAQRLAALADVVIYKNGSLDSATGPIFESVTISDDRKTVVVTFTNVGEGLTTKDGGVNVLGIVGLSDDIFGHQTVTPVSATITSKNEITVVFSSEVKAVAYNYDPEDHYGETINLCNSFACPASAFITPYKDKDVSNYAESDLVDKNSSGLSHKGTFFDYLKADGQDLFDVGLVVNGLQAQGNSVDVYYGTGDLALIGWSGFGRRTLMFGYSIDGGDIVFDSYPLSADQGVIDAAGRYAARFNVHIDIGDLSMGTHTVTLAALVDLKDGVAVRMLTFNINIIERPTVPEEPQDYPSYKASEYRLTSAFFDYLYVDEEKYFIYYVEDKLTAANNTVSAKKGTQTIALQGWIGFEYEINCFGYAIDEEDPILNSTPIAPEQGVIDLGGEYAKRFNIVADVSELDVGTYNFNYLVSIQKDGEAAIIKLVSFTLEITE